MAAPYYVTHDAGGEGVGSEGDPFTLAEACDAVAAGETVYVKASGDYTVQDGANNCVMHITVAGTSGAVINWIGYHTTITDGGIVKINADTNSLASAAISAGGVYNAYVNFDFQGASGDGFSAVVDDYIVFKNCRFYLNDGHGVSGDNYMRFVNCIASNNGASGFDGDVNHVFICCISHTNVKGFYVDLNDALMYNCLAYNNSSHDYECGNARAALLGCTTDCEGAAGDYCMSLSGIMDTVVNCVLHDGDYGIYSATYGGHGVISRHNVFNSSNTADVRANYWLPTSEGDGTGNRGDVVDPATMFLNEAADDYTPHATGGMVGVGIDAYFCQQFWADYNNGAGDNPPAE